MLFVVSKITFVLLFIFTSLSANQILSNTQETLLDLSNEKIIQDTSKLKKDVLNPIRYSYIYAKDEKFGISKKSIISIDQPIFRSGGIYYAIKYASNLKNSSTLSLNIQRKNLIVQVLTNVYNIKKLDIQIEKQKLLLANSKIDLKIKKESVFNGLLSMSFLNNALITVNKTKLSLINLEFSKNSLINNLKNLSDLKYTQIKLPKLDILNHKDFIKNNLDLKNSQLSLKSKDYLKGITNAKYLPSINVNYKKTIAHSNALDNYNYGFSINVPINFTTINAMQSAKIDYLKQKEQNKLSKISQNIFFDTKILSIKNINDKIYLTKENIKSYENLLNQTQELSDAGLKTVDDIKILKNSLKNEKLNINLYKIDEQIELLEIYKRVKNDKI